MKTDPTPTEHLLQERLEAIERRLAALEARPAGRATVPVPSAAGAGPSVATQQSHGQSPVATGEELEFEVGQNWFALVGIVALIAGLGFMLAQPWSSLPAWVPSMGGAAIAVLLLVLASLWRGTYELVARFFWGGGLVVFYFAVVRLFYFGNPSVFPAASAWPGPCLFASAVAIVVVGYCRESIWLGGLGLLTVAASSLILGGTGAAWTGLLLLAGLVSFLVARRGWDALLLPGNALGLVVYALWMVNGPQLGRPLRIVADGGAGPLVLLAHAGIIAAGYMLRTRAKTEGPLLGVGSVLNCALGYGLFLAHTVAAHRGALAGFHAAGFAVFLGIAVAFWLRAQSRIATFLYAMTGYLALSVAIMKAVTGPAVFVWLSVQSVVVVATAIWFRSRFIIVANFLIYVMIMLGYVVAVKVESGISVGFGLVALASARILRWQQKRLELKTELMRNAYLASAFVVFPYALYHLIEGKLVALAWVGLALFYYLANLIVRSPKFRWMGHATLLLTALYLAIAGTSRFSPAYRVLSFLVLGMVLLVVSVIFTRLRKRRESGGSPPAPG